MNLITASEVITWAFIGIDLLSTKIKSTFIDIAQEKYLRPALGDTFFEELTAATPTGENKTLVDTYIKPALAYYVKYIALPDISLQVTNIGVQVPTTQTGEAGTDKQRGLLREQAMENGNVLMEKAIRYIEDNYTLFPNYEYAETVQSTTKVLGGIIF